MGENWSIKWFKKHGLIDGACFGTTRVYFHTKGKPWAITVGIIWVRRGLGVQDDTKVSL